MITYPVAFFRADSGRLKVDQGVLSKMTRYAQLSPGDTEAGGLLLGRHILDSDDIVVDLVTVPMPGDIRTRTTFHRRSKMHQVIMEKAWRESNETCTYLGEWHTHPEAVPIPSGTDRNNWLCRLREDTYEGDALFFAILGIDELLVWEVSMGDDQLQDQCLERI